MPRKNVVLGLHQATPGQAASRERKLRCKTARRDRYEAEAKRRGVAAHLIPGILQKEMNDKAAARKRAAAAEAECYRERWDRPRYPSWRGSSLSSRW